MDHLQLLFSIARPPLILMLVNNIIISLRYNFRIGYHFNTLCHFGGVDNL